MAACTVRIPAPLRSFTGGASEVEAQGATVHEVLHDLVAKHEGLQARLLDGDGNLRAFINVFLGDENIRALDGSATTVSDGAVLHLVPAVAGGGGR